MEMHILWMGAYLVVVQMKLLLLQQFCLPNFVRFSGEAFVPRYVLSGIMRYPQGATSVSLEAKQQMIWSLIYRVAYVLFIRVNSLTKIHIFKPCTY